MAKSNSYKIEAPAAGGPYVPRESRELLLSSSCHLKQEKSLRWNHPRQTGNRLKNIGAFWKRLQTSTTWLTCFLSDMVTFVQRGVYKTVFYHLGFPTRSAVGSTRLPWCERLRKSRLITIQGTKDRVEAGAVGHFLFLFGRKMTESKIQLVMVF